MPAIMDPTALVRISFWLIVFNYICADELCGDTRSNVRSGVIKLPDLSGQLVEDLNCTWIYSAPPDHKLLVKVDSVQLPPPHIRTSSLQLFVDDQLFEIPRNCVKCLGEIVGGHTIRATFLSTLAPFSVANLSLDSDVLSSQTVGTFQVRYKSFDPHLCEKPKSPDNGYVIDKGWKLHQEIFYHCNPPYDLVGDSSAICTVLPESPVPNWSAQPPKCTIRDCREGVIHREAGAGAIANPGYPTRILAPSTACQWEIEAKSGNVQATLTYLRLPDDGQSERITDLMLYDGDTSTPILPSNDDYSQPFNFTTKSRKLIVHYSKNAEKKVGWKLGFYLEYNAVKSSCSDPGPPVNGEIVVYSLTVGSVVSYRCLPRFVLIGESLSECLPNGRWSAPKPSCKGPVSSFSETLMTASNSTDTVVGNFTDKPPPTKATTAPKKKKKPGLGSKKSTTGPKAPKTTSNKYEPRPTSEDPKEGVPEDERRIKSDKGPKSEPHLQQVIPKEPSKPSEHQQVEDPEEQRETSDLPTKTDDDVKVGGDEGPDEMKLSITMIMIIVGVAGPVAIVLILLIVIIIYRKRYPVRMRFGRKFSTFENPMYIRKDANHPRELKRLTT